MAPLTRAPPAATPGMRRHTTPHAAGRRPRAQGYAASTHHATKRHTPCKRRALRRAMLRTVEATGCRAGAGCCSGRHIGHPRRHTRLAQAEIPHTGNLPLPAAQHLPLAPPVVQAKRRITVRQDNAAALDGAAAREAHALIPRWVRKLAVPLQLPRLSPIGSGDGRCAFLQRNRCALGAHLTCIHRGRRPPTPRARVDHRGAYRFPPPSKALPELWLR